MGHDDNAVVRGSAPMATGAGNECDRSRLFRAAPDDVRQRWSHLAPCRPPTEDAPEEHEAVDASDSGSPEIGHAFALASNCLFRRSVQQIQ
jgi:hypothetical protein